jgi:hypothetical protein
MVRLLAVDYQAYRSGNHEITLGYAQEKANQA